jgi:hypothetical protein
VTDRVPVPSHCFVAPSIAVGASKASSKACPGAARRYKSGATGHRIYGTSVASVYRHYVSKAEKKGRTKEEVDEIRKQILGRRRRPVTMQRLRRSTVPNSMTDG